MGCDLHNLVARVEEWFAGVDLSPRHILAEHLAGGEQQWRCHECCSEERAIDGCHGSSPREGENRCFDCRPLPGEERQPSGGSSSSRRMAVLILRVDVANAGPRTLSEVARLGLASRSDVAIASVLGVAIAVETASLGGGWMASAIACLPGVATWRTWRSSSSWSRPRGWPG